MNSGTDIPSPTGHKNSNYWLWLGLQSELALFRRPLFVLSVLAIVLVPSLYAVFYVSSFWDPYGHLDRLPAALVNADHGVSRNGHDVNLGDTIEKTLERQHPFRFVRLPSAPAADEALRRGEVYFTLVIPADFSERALAARKNEPANLILQVAESASYTGAIISRRFGNELVQTLNEQLNSERWVAIVGNPDASATNSLRAVIRQLRDGSQKLYLGTQRLQEGSERLDQGLNQAAAGAVSLNNGMGQIAGGLREMHDRLPTTDQLQELASGSKAAVAGEEKLETGIEQLAAGGKRLNQGADQLRQGAARIPFGGRRLSDGAAQLETGIATLNTNLLLAATGGQELQVGLEQLNDGVQPLTSGLMQLETNLQLMINELPPAEGQTNLKAASGQLAQGGAELTNGLARLSNGSHQLAESSKELEVGATKMVDGLDRLDTGLTEELGNADADGLAGSVRLNVESYAPVSNNGAAYSPYFASLTLWLGGIMITFVFHCRRLIEPLKDAPRWVCWLAKSTMPLGLGVLQAAVVVAVFRLGFGIPFAHPWQVWLAATVGSLSFVSVIVLLIAVLGDAGRLPAVILLILQLAAAGGIYPVELSGRFYEVIHPYLPFTALVNAFRATMFGAFDGSWTAAAAQLVVTGCGAAVLAIWLARWKYVPRESYGPAVDFS